MLDDPIKTNHSSSIYGVQKKKKALQFIDITMQVEAPFKFYPSVTHNTQIPRTYTSFLQGSHLYKKQKNLSAFFWLFRRLNKAILSAKLFAKTY